MLTSEGSSHVQGFLCCIGCSPCDRCGQGTGLPAVSPNLWQSPERWQSEITSVRGNGLLASVDLSLYNICSSISQGGCQDYMTDARENTSHYAWYIAQALETFGEMGTTWKRIIWISFLILLSCPRTQSPGQEKGRFFFTTSFNRMFSLANWAGRRHQDWGGTAGFLWGLFLILKSMLIFQSTL